MNPEQAWQSVLGQLQMEMPKASFDTWVRDTRARSYDNGVMTVAVRNAYARDWLESRLASTVSRLLVGILNTNVAVNFVVEETTDDEEDNVEVASDQEQESHIPDNVVEINAEEYQSAYEQIVRPDRAVYLPGYFRRWLKATGPDLGWMYVAFHQAAYVAGARKGSASNRFSGTVIARLAGISERTYWNRLGNPATWEKLKGLVEIIDAGPEWDTNSSTPKRLPRRYTVAMTLPLTSTDAASIRKWIAQNIETLGGPEAVLRVAIEVPLDELIPANAEPKDGDEPMTVRKLVRDLYKDQLDGNLLDSLASALQNHIMAPNDLIVISLFFLEHILPRLGAGPAWMLSILRDMCYVDPKSGEVRNRVVVKGGYAEIAGWMGMSRPLTIYEWLQSKKGDVFREAGLRMYLREAKREKELGFETSDRTFDVATEEIPHELLELALTGQDLAAYFAPETRQLYATCSIGFTRLADDNYATCSIAFTQLAHELYAACSIVFTPVADDLYATCTGVLNSLTPLKPNPLNLNPHPSQKTRNSPALTQLPAETSTMPSQPLTSKSGGMGSPAFWDFDFLIENNSVQPQGKKNLLITNKKFGRNIKRLSEGFVSWLLYAYSPTGSRVNDPVALAVKRLCTEMHEGAGGDLNRLAQMPPHALKSLFDADLAGKEFLGDSIEANIYSINFQGLLKIHKQELYRRLFGS